MDERGDRGASIRPASKAQVWSTSSMKSEVWEPGGGPTEGAEGSTVEEAKKLRRRVQRSLRRSDGVADQAQVRHKVRMCLFIERGMSCNL